MDNPVWPANIPGFQVGWSFEPADNILRSKPERGPAKTRRLTTKNSMTVTGKILLGNSELDALYSFINDDIGGGADEFLWPDFIHNQYSRARFASIPKVSQLSGNSYETEVTLEVEY